MQSKDKILKHADEEINIKIDDLDLEIFHGRYNRKVVQVDLPTSWTVHRIKYKKRLNLNKKIQSQYDVYSGEYRSRKTRLPYWRAEHVRPQMRFLTAYLNKV